MNDKKNIERLFQEKFKDFEVTPPPGVWDGIASQLEKKKEKRRIFPFWFNAKAAGIAAALVLGLFVLNNNQGWFRWDFNESLNDKQNRTIVVEGQNAIDKNSVSNGIDKKMPTNKQDSEVKENNEAIVSTSAEETLEQSQQNTGLAETDDFSKQSTRTKSQPTKPKSVPYTRKQNSERDAVLVHSTTKQKEQPVQSESNKTFTDLKTEKSFAVQDRNTEASQQNSVHVAENQNSKVIERQKPKAGITEKTVQIAEADNAKKEGRENSGNGTAVGQKDVFQQNSVQVAEGQGLKSIDRQKEKVNIVENTVQITETDNVKKERSNNSVDVNSVRRNDISRPNNVQIATNQNAKAREEKKPKTNNDGKINQIEASTILKKNEDDIADKSNPLNQKEIAETDNAKDKNQYAEKKTILEIAATNKQGVASKIDKVDEQKNSISVPFGKEQKDSTAIVLTEENPLEKLLKEKEEKKNEDKDKEETKESPYSKWGIRPAVAVLFSGSTQGSPISGEFANNKKVFDTKLGLGLGVDYQLSKKIAFRTGVSKVDLAYNTEGISFYTDLSTKFSKQYTMRNINKNSASENMFIEDRRNETSLEIASFGKESGELNQQIGYIEVPVEVSYKIIDKKFGLHLITGLSTLFLSDNKISIISNGMTTEIGEANNLNKIHFSTNIGLGLKYNIIKSLEASVEPMFKYQINTFSNDSGNFKPFVVGVYSGLSYKF